MITRDQAYLLSRVQILGSGCWRWTQPLGNHGYGQLCVNGKLTTAHRAAYVLFVGPIPKGYHIDHLCRNRCCVNPLHLEAVTHAENNRRAQEFHKSGSYATHCPLGHPYNSENTKVKRNGGRDCRACGRIQKGCDPGRATRPFDPPNFRKTHCPQGHPYTPENTYQHKTTKGYSRRRCKTCHRARQNKRRE